MCKQCNCKDEKKKYEKQVFVNEAKRTVVVKVSNEYGEAVGKAKCFPTDVFSERNGRIIASLKADENLNKRELREINVDINSVKKYLSELEFEAAKREKNIENCRSRRESFIKKINE